MAELVIGSRRESAQATEALRMPKGPNGRGARLNAPALRRAIAELGLEAPVIVRWSTGQRRRGCHRWRDGKHVVTLSSNKEASKVSHTLWHELVHCRQLEDDRDGFHDAYAQAEAVHGYKANPFEIEATEFGKVMHERSPLAS